VVLKISFVLPGYYPFPIGGYRVVFEYANFLAARGHELTIVFPRKAIAEPSRGSVERLKELLWGPRIRLMHRPLVSWHEFHAGVRFVLTPHIRNVSVPDGDVVVATGWQTAEPVCELSPHKGEKFYLIQHFENWSGPEERVKRTWRMPLHKIVISRWLKEMAITLGDPNSQHIPNGIDLQSFRVVTPPAARPMSILSLYHNESIKGVPDALDVLARYHQIYPDVPITMFGALPPGPDLPAWVQYHKNPGQEMLIRNLYNMNAVYFSASLAEGWALPPAEAMACGCAFVGTEIGGFRDYATDGETALLSPSGDRERLLRNLIRITEDHQLRARIQQRGTENIQQFTWDAAGHAMEMLFLDHAPR
jgi:glycosyltransferase involved in cell wall biosynthesis